MLLYRPAVVATRRVFEIPWTPVTCTRVETWTSYRGEDCENEQRRSLDIIQEGRLRKQTGQKLGHHTGGKTATTNRIEAWTSYRLKDCENKQGRDWDILQRVDL